MEKQKDRISVDTCTKCQHCGRWTNYAGDAHHKARIDMIEKLPVYHDTGTSFVPNRDEVWFFYEVPGRSGYCMADNAVYCGGKWIYYRKKDDLWHAGNVFSCQLAAVESCCSDFVQVALEGIPSDRPAAVLD